MPHPNIILFSCLSLLLPTLALGADKPPDKPVPVIVAATQRQSLAERIEALGTLKANESVTLTAHATETVAAIHFDDGQRVRAGELLVELTHDEEDALLEEARVRAGEAQRQYERVRSLVEQRSASESLLDERKRDLDTTRALLVALEARLADRLIKAPFKGVVGLRQISPGALVQPGEPITTLDDDSLMKLDFAVPSVHLSALAPGLKIEARSRAQGERIFTGTVRGVDSRVDPVTRTVQVRALIPNPDGRLKPGLLMQVDVLIDPREGLVVPEAALLQQGTDHFVMALSEGQEPLTATRRPVEIGTRQPGWVEIRAGLAAGERVIVDGQDKVRPGQPLKIMAVGDGRQGLQTLTESAP